MKIENMLNFGETTENWLTLPKKHQKVHCFFAKSITEENIFLLKKIEKMLKFGQKTDNLVNSTEKTPKSVIFDFSTFF